MATWEEVRSHELAAARRAQEMGLLLSRLSMRLGDARDPATAFFRITEFLVPQLAPLASIHTLSPAEGSGLWSLEQIAFDSPESEKTAEILGKEEGLCALEPILSACLRKQGVIHRSTVELEGIHALLAVPLAWSSGNGVLTLFSATEGQVFNQWHQHMVRELANHAEMAIERTVQIHESRARFQRQQELTSLTSHEINNSLTTLNLQLALLSRASGGNASNPELFDRLIRNSRQMVEEISRHLEDSRNPEAFSWERLELELSPIPLAELVADCMIGCLNPVEIDIPAGLILSADPKRLREVLLNLRSNAEKYAPGARIGIETRVYGRKMELYFRDEGPGIPARSEDEIFKLRHRLETGHAVEGQGIGLYIVRQIMSAHGGQIMVFESQSPGLCLKLTFPNAIPPANGPMGPLK